MYCYRRGNGQKPPRTKPSGQKPSRTIEREFVRGAFVRIFFTRPTKNRGALRCVTYFWGVPGCVTKCDRWVWGGQNWPKIAWRTLWTALGWYRPSCWVASAYECSLICYEFYFEGAIISCDFVIFHYSSVDLSWVGLFEFGYCPPHEISHGCIGPIFDFASYVFDATANRCLISNLSISFNDTILVLRSLLTQPVNRRSLDDMVTEQIR